VTPDPRLESNPHWTQTASGTPVTSLLTERVTDRLMVCVGRHPQSHRIATNSRGSGSGVVDDSVTTEETAYFVTSNLSIQQCSGFMLEEVVLSLPVSGGDAQGRNLTQNLCGDFVDEAYVEPRRFVFSVCDMNVPIQVAGRTYTFDMSNFIPNGRRISYYTLGNAINYFINGWTAFMKNVLGDTNFYATVYVDAISPRLFWYSGKYGLNAVRILLKDALDEAPGFLQILKNHIFFTDMRVGDDSQQGTTGAGTLGESIGFMAREQTGQQNNALLMTVHSNELTQFRKIDNIAPADGQSMIGALIPHKRSGTGTVTLTASVKDGSLISPKIAFDKTQTLTEFSIHFRVSFGNYNTVVQMSSTELSGSSAVLVFRAW